MEPEETAVYDERTSANMQHYYELFPDDRTKAAAFDRLARHFYDANFGTMAKADIEVFMFSEYIERILANEDCSFRDYSDYALSKWLGIPQSRVANLKVKKQLKYPHPYKWKESFLDVCKNLQYEKDKIKIQIPDINLYYEIKNAVEELGGYVEVTLTSKLLQISPGYYIDLLLSISPDKSRKVIRKALRDEIRVRQKDAKYLESDPFGKQRTGRRSRPPLHRRRRPGGRGRTWWTGAARRESSRRGCCPPAGSGSPGNGPPWR